MKYYFFVLFFALPLFASAQKVDSVAIREVDSLIQISRSLTRQNNFTLALEVNSFSETIALNKLGNESAAYGSCCFNHGRIMYFMGNYPEAEKWYLESKSIREKVLGELHADYAWSLNNLALVYANMGVSEKAELLFLESKAIREKVLGKMHSDYAWSLDNLANLYKETGRYIEAEQLYLEAKEIREKLLGKNHSDYGSSLNNLANLYRKKGEYEIAESYYLEAMSIHFKTLGKNNREYANDVNNLANLYRLEGQYEKAEPLYIESKDIREKALGKDHPDYAASLNNLGIFYMELGKFEEAEPLYMKSKDIREKALGKDHPDYAQSLNNLANLYWDMSFFEKAEPLYLEAKDIWGKKLGLLNPDYAQSLHNLATMYMDMKQYEKAESLYLEAMSIWIKAFGKNNAYYPKGLTNLAQLYHEKGLYEKAESLNLEAMDIWAKSIGMLNVNYAKNINNLANLYRDIGEYRKAELLYIEVDSLWEKTMGKTNFDYTTIPKYMALLYSCTGQYSKSDSLYMKLLDLNKVLLHKALYYFSERELNTYIKKFIESQDQTISFAKLSNSSKVLPTCYDNLLFYKGYLLNSTEEIIRLAHTDSLSTEKYNRLKGYRRRLAAQEALSIAERDSAVVAELDAKANDLEKDLARTISGFGEATQHVSWEDVQFALKPKETAIEFVRFQYWDKKQTDSVLYAALVLRPEDDSPHYVYLCTEAQLKSVLDRWDEGSVETSPAEVYWQKEGEPSLYNLLWKPLESLLPRGSAVWYAPDGLLHRLNLAAISPGLGRSLADDYSFHRTGSTRQLVIKETSQPTGPEAALFGGLRYESDTLAIEQSLKKQGIPYALRSIDERRPASPENDSAILRDGSIDFLDNSLMEVQDISKSLKTAGFTPHAYTDFSGTEEAFLSLAGSKTKKSPRILHMATHGYFFPDPKADTTHQRSALDTDRPVPYKSSDNPLIRSGLLLSGCEQAWRTGKPASGRLADGILTAADIASMDLSNTELAVLSACQTGLGDVESNEGVYGLQRAFKIAGARYLIMSLWKVDDRVTMKLMTSFYAKWLDKKKPLNIPEAFSAAQRELRKEYPDPFFWAGFVLVE